MRASFTHHSHLRPVSYPTINAAADPKAATSFSPLRGVFCGFYWRKAHVSPVAVQVVQILDQKTVVPLDDILPPMHSIKDMKLLVKVLNCSARFAVFSLLLAS